MAQYYQVLSQDSKTTEESPQYYQNIEEGQTVQYVIATEGSQQPFQAQPVVVVEGQGQQVIIDQSQITYQTPYIVQDSGEIDFQNNPQQQVFYMANNSQPQPIVVEQTAQPVVLNHQLMQSPTNKVEVATPVTVQRAIGTSVIQEKPIQIVRNQVKASRPSINQRSVQISPQKEELVSLPDGTLVTVNQYRRLLAAQKQNQAFQEKLNAQNMNPSNLQGKGRNVMRNAPRNPRPGQQLRGGARVNSFRQHTPVEEQQQFTEQEVSPSKQTLQQYQARQPHQQINRAQQNQNQYLIQPPRPRDHRASNTKPLPSFLHSGQIQAIIENTPVNEEFSDSIRMLVLLDNGEQRLITFTLPKEACTIQEILEQVNVPFTTDTPLAVNETDVNGLNYIVTVGNVPGFNPTELQSEEYPSNENSYAQQSAASESELLEGQKSSESVSLPSTDPSPELPKELPPKLIQDRLAVCSHCGYLSEDFNKCTRCRSKLPENVKDVAAINHNGKKLDPRTLINEKKFSLVKTNGVPRMNLLHKKRSPKPAKIMECETVVVSSDEEESEAKISAKNVSEQLLEKLGNSVTLSPISKEPSIIDIQKYGIQAATRIVMKSLGEPTCSTIIGCRTVRIGSYRFVPLEEVRVDTNGLMIKTPHPKQENIIRIIKVDNADIVKVLVSFQKSLPVIFYYLLPSVGITVRSMLDMTPGSDLYFDPLSESEEAHRRITLLPEILTEESKHVLQKIYSKNYSIMEELTYKEANDILIKTCPKELTKSVLPSYGGLADVKQVLSYPPEGRGRITINTEDYLCLGSDQFLNDVIIDFYLKYLFNNMTKDQQEKVYIFSNFFYKRLTTKPVKASRKSQPTELDPNLTPAEKRHSRVKTWTKNVNVFEKDFIIVPINENCHWFLAIICFPSMNGSHTMDGQSIKIEPRQTKKAKEKKKLEQTITCEDPDLSDKDEAEGDESELDSDDSDEPPTLSVENNSKRPPIKQPCILIFDSLAGASRSRVVATLRDYLTCEYKAKMGNDKIFTKDVIKGACPKVPQQTNFTDCGLYLLQYVEHFFKDPIKDFYIPINQLKNWFEEIIVTKKREDISLLIKSLMKESGKDLNLLPDVVFPTLNGELTENAMLEKEDNFTDPDEPDETMEEEEEEEDEEEALLSRVCTKTKIVEIAVNDSSVKIPVSPIKPSSESLKNKDNVEQTVINATLLKPDVSELPKSNKDTLSYLKAKRIIRHKNVNSNNPEGPDAKKVRSDTAE